jgi:hypothetical protein
MRDPRLRKKVGSADFVEDICRIADFKARTVSITVTRLYRSPQNGTLMENQTNQTTHPKFFRKYLVQIVSFNTYI